MKYSLLTLTIFLSFSLVFVCGLKNEENNFEKVLHVCPVNHINDGFHVLTHKQMPSINWQKIFF